MYMILNKLNESSKGLQNGCQDLRRVLLLDCVSWTCQPWVAASAIDLIMCYKILFNLVDVKLDDIFQYSTVVTTRGRLFKLFKECSDTNARKCFEQFATKNCWPRVGPGYLHSVFFPLLSIHFLIFCSLFTFCLFPFFIHFTNFLLLSITSLFTRIVSLV